jgi:hypothetical protein
MSGIPLDAGAGDKGMSYASLMVLVDVDDKFDGPVKIAADLADRFHAGLIGVARWAPMSVFPAKEDNPTRYCCLTSHSRPQTRGRVQRLRTKSSEHYSINM